MKYEFIFRDRERQVIRSAEEKITLMCLLSVSLTKRCSTWGKRSPVKTDILGAVLA